jgi:hypothetical protein
MVSKIKQKHSFYKCTKKNEQNQKLYTSSIEVNLILMLYRQLSLIIYTTNSISFFHALFHIISIFFCSLRFCAFIIFMSVLFIVWESRKKKLKMLMLYNGATVFVSGFIEVLIKIISYR